MISPDDRVVFLDCDNALLDNITRGLLTDGTLQRCINEFSVTGLTSNPTIFDHAVRNGDLYDAPILQGRAGGESGETLFFVLVLEDPTRAADLFRPAHDRAGRVDGRVHRHDAREAEAGRSGECGATMTNDRTAPTRSLTRRPEWKTLAQRTIGGLRGPGALAGAHGGPTTAPGPEVMARYGFSVEHVVATAKAVLAR